MVRTHRPLGMPGIVVLTAAIISLLVYLAATGGSLALAQTPAAGDKPKYGGILRLAEREPPNLDPHLSVSFNPQNIGSLIYNGLVRFPYGHEQKDPYDLTIMPDLAERWEYADDKTVVFYLRKGVKFHDKPPVNGREVKAPDVKYSLERFASKSGFRARFDDIDHIDVVDDYTVKIVTKYPFAPLLVNLASPSHNFIFPKEAEDKYGDFNKVEAAIGTGPFILERYERGVKLIFKRNPDFYMKGLPYVDGSEWQMTPEASARVSLLRTGKVDFVHTTGLLAGEEAIPLQRTNPDLKFFKYQSSGDDWSGQSDPHRSLPELSRVWGAPAASNLGWHAEPAGAELHVSGALASHLARGGSECRGVRLQYVWRRPARPARPSSPRWAIVLDLYLGHRIP